MTTPTSTILRHPAHLAALAGCAWLLLGVESIVRPEPMSYRDVAFVIPWLLTLATVVALHRGQRARGDAAERLGYLGVAATMVVIAVGGPALVSDSTLVTRMVAAATVLWMLSMVAFGIGTVRARVHPARVGVGLVVAEPLTIATGAALSVWVPVSGHGSYTGAIANGALFLMISGMNC
ncbi:hypothetical protein [Gordonia insulae]|uniref:Uncharacterized protein n=1 Tax=Gordonia insulae TaxID=2420509 RepID=A0A3G8JMX0_9ACTN|nr:hypothetical protein [Gordonia insulae]AZG46441.1 hypothetical protein D7316_03042 [Gordonia insulae]